MFGTPVTKITEFFKCFEMFSLKNQVGIPNPRKQKICKHDSGRRAKLSERNRRIMKLIVSKTKRKKNKHQTIVGKETDDPNHHIANILPKKQ